MVESGKRGLWGYATDADARRAFVAIVERWRGDDPVELREDQDESTQVRKQEHTPSPPISPACRQDE